MMGRISRFLRNNIASGTVGMPRGWIAKGFPFSSREIVETMISLTGRITR